MRKWNKIFLYPNIYWTDDNALQEQAKYIFSNAFRDKLTTAHKDIKIWQKQENFK